MVSLLGKILKLLPLAGLGLVGWAIALSVQRGQMDQLPLVMILGGFLLFLAMFLRVESASLRYYANLGIVGALALANLALLYLLAANHPGDWDLTAGKRRSLSPQTIQVFENLKKPIHLEAMAISNEPYRSYLARYARLSDRVTYSITNPFSRPATEDPAEDEVTMNELRVSSGEQTMRLKFDQETDFESIERKLEREILNAVLTLVQDRAPRLYFTTRHGEKTPQSIPGEGGERRSVSRFAEYLVERGMEPRMLDLYEDRLVPDDCDLLVILGPRVDFAPVEVEALRRYLQGGGALLACFEPALPPHEDPLRLRALLDDYGLRVSGDILVDYGSSVAETSYFNPLLKHYNPIHPITEKVQARANDLPLSESTTIERHEDLERRGLRAKDLILSSEKSWTLTPAEFESVAQSGKMTLAPADSWKPRAVAVAAEPAPGRPGPRIVLFGDADFLTNAQLGDIQALLGYFSITWLTGKTDLIELPPRAIEETPLLLNPRQRNWISILCVVLIPFAIFFGGLGATTLRRRKR